MGSFRKIDFPLDAFPVDWRTNGRQDLLSLPSSVSGGFVSTEMAMHEWTGLLFDWLTGRSLELFPKP
jgi:hypothetical protein